jgi:hypothetical protein
MFVLNKCSCYYFGIVVGVAVDVSVGVTVDVVVGIAVSVTVGVAAGVIVGVTVGIAAGVIVGVTVGVAAGVIVGITVGVAVDNCFVCSFVSNVFGTANVDVLSCADVDAAPVLGAV